MEILMKKQKSSVSGKVMGAKTMLSLFVYLSIALFFSQCSIATAEEQAASRDEIAGFASKLIEVNKRSTSTFQEVQNVPVVQTSILKRLVRSAVRKGSAHSSCASCNITHGRIVVAKPGCQPMKLKVKVCSGRCDTWEIPDVSPRHSEYNHTVCSPLKAVSRKLRLKGCAPNVNPYYNITYPESCTCAPCSSSRMACRNLQ